MADKSEPTKSEPVTPALTREQLLAGLALLSPEERAAVLGGGTVQTNTTPKMQPAIAAVKDVKGASEAIRACLKAQNDPAAFAESLTALRGKFPELAAAIERNSAYRRKTTAHSLTAALTALAMR